MKRFGIAAAIIKIFFIGATFSVKKLLILTNAGFSFEVINLFLVFIYRGIICFLIHLLFTSKLTSKFSRSTRVWYHAVHFIYYIAGWEDYAFFITA